jgi:hypothetical protein
MITQPICAAWHCFGYDLHCQEFDAGFAAEGIWIEGRPSIPVAQYQHYASATTEITRSH